MNCEEGNKVDLVKYLFSFGFIPAKIRGNNYWCISPLRDEKEASFKIDRNKNVWYDHGAGKGCTVVHFITSYFNCDAQRALQKLSSYQQIPE
jgi:DNA primase